MRLFSWLYDRVLVWSHHPHAVRYLAIMSFIESIFFPIPCDVVLAPMVLAKPHKAWTYAAITSVTSVLGGVVGYCLGWLAFDAWVQPAVEYLGYQDRLAAAMQWFEDYGFWAIFLAGFSPIPYKVFTITAGLVLMPFAPFLIASIVGRSARFYLVASLVKWGGATIEPKLRRFVDVIGWAVVLIVIIAVVVNRFL